MNDEISLALSDAGISAEELAEAGVTMEQVFLFMGAGVLPETEEEMISAFFPSMNLNPEGV